MTKFKFTAVVVMIAAAFAFHHSRAQSPALVTTAPVLKLGDPMPGNLFVELAKAINPTVVNISTSVISRNMGRDPFWDQLEQMYGIQGRPPVPAGKPQAYSLGTGFVIREDGLIVTNAHVVKNADLVTVSFTEGDGKNFEAKIIGSDERADIALLKIQPDHKLAVAALGNSGNVQVGEWVAAFGNPFGHGHSVTKGIISSIGRSLSEINRFPLLQTDAAINPGNSGGPLVDTKGFVIGVNSAIDARAQGIGFAIPIDEVKRILPDLENRGRLRKGYLGVGLADIVSYADQTAAGAGVVNLQPGSPAEKAGIRYGDAIVEFNGKKIHNSLEITDAVAGLIPGSPVAVKVIRQVGASERTLNLTVTIGEQPDPHGRRQARHKPESNQQKAPFEFGFSMTDLNPELRAQYELPGDLQKPVITAVDEGSSAAFVGLSPGDVILEVNHNEVKSTKDVTAKMKKDGNTLKVARGNRIIITTINK